MGKFNENLIEKIWKPQCQNNIDLISPKKKRERKKVMVTPDCNPKRRKQFRLLSYPGTVLYILYIHIYKYKYIESR